MIGSGPCGYAFIDRMLKNNKDAKILCLERGSYFLPEHFQNLPQAFSRAVGLNGLTETFPWTLSYNTHNNRNGFIKFQRGQLPVFGGRSVLWSSWCPRPTEELLKEWPKDTRDTLLNTNILKDSEDLLHVISSNKINNNSSSSYAYGILQETVFNLLKKNINKDINFDPNRLMYAPLASSPATVGISFEKWSSVGPLLSLINDYPLNLDVVTNATVEKIISQSGDNIFDNNKKEEDNENDNNDHDDYIVTALQTSRGNIKINDNTKLILSMGMYPATTLVANSFSKLTNKVGNRLSVHFISSIVAKYPRNMFKCNKSVTETEIGAIYIEGRDMINKNDKLQYPEFHIQLSIISDKSPEKNKNTLFRYAPDVVASASPEQLIDSKNDVIFVCAVLGELDYHNKRNWFKLKTKENKKESNTNNITENMIVQIIENQTDLKLWDTMDNATFTMLEEMLIDHKDNKNNNIKGKDEIQYWHVNKWVKGKRPTKKMIRVPGVVHESSCMHIGDSTDKKSIVDTNYKLRTVRNTYVTGAALWPRGGSWNPTLTMCAMAQDCADKLSNKK